LKNTVREAFVWTIFHYASLLLSIAVSTVIHSIITKKLKNSAFFLLEKDFTIFCRIYSCPVKLPLFHVYTIIGILSWKFDACKRQIWICTTMSTKGAYVE